MEIEAAKPKPPIKKRIVNSAIYVLENVNAIDGIGNMLAERLPKIVRIEEYQSGFTPRFLDLTRQGMVPQMVIGHFNHLDPLFASDLGKSFIDLADVHDLSRNLNGFAATLAASVPGGQQGRIFEAFYDTAKSYAAKRGVDFFAVTRQKDKDEFGMKLDRAEMKKFIEKLKQKGSGAILLPGGTVQPGRHPEGAKGDDIFGLQRVAGSDILDVYSLMEKHGRRVNQEPYFLPVGIDQTYRVFSCDSSMLTPEGIVSLFDGASKMAEGLGIFGFKRIFVNIRAGMPITAEDMKNRLGSDWKNNPQEVNDLLMGEIAILLPANARGYYGNKVASKTAVGQV
jgi:hypothetical protein